MKIYEERENATHYIFEVRPRALFQLEVNTESSVHPETRAGRFKAWHRLNNRMEVFALIRGKGYTHSFARANVEKAPELFLTEDEKQLKLAHQFR